MTKWLDGLDKIAEILHRPRNHFHDAGVLSSAALETMVRCAEPLKVSNSVETGCGVSTLLLSRLSAHHRVFTIESHGDVPAKSVSAVRNSKLFNCNNVDFVFGPTQSTLPAAHFDRPLQIVLIDGPHGFPFPQLEYFFLYPHLEENGLLILDDIHIPTITPLALFLKEDEMFEHIDSVSTTWFFQRTDKPTFDPYGDEWWLQTYNDRRIESYSRKYQKLPFRRRIYDRLVAVFGIQVADMLRKSYRGLR